MLRPSDQTTGSAMMSGFLQLFSHKCPVKALVVFNILFYQYTLLWFLNFFTTGTLNLFASCHLLFYRAVLAVDKKEQAEVYNIYLRKAAEIYGVTRTRQIYEKAIEILTEAESRTMCLRFAEMETKLGEVDRARAIFTHASQMCDPR